MSTDDHHHSSRAKITSVDDLKRLYPDQFDTIENFKAKAKILLKEGAEPSIDAPRKCSVHLKPKLKAELDQMEQQGVIRKVTHHTDWCSSLTTSVKQNGSLRVCPDPKRLNQSLKRCPRKIPTVEYHQAEFDALKHSITIEACLQYYNPEVPAVLGS